MDKPILSKQAFWDVDMDKIDYQTDLLYIIEQVVDWGTFEDFLLLTNFYGIERIGREVVNTKVLGDIEVNFCCFMLDIRIADFKYYEKRLSRSLSKFKKDFQNYLNY